MAVTVYSTPTCPYCHKAKDFLKEKGVEFEDVNVAEDAARQKEMIDKSGQMGVPVLDVNGTIIVGFNPKAIEDAL
jgi:glutaredoxin 3